MMAGVHNAAMMFPARVLGDRQLWPRLRADLESWLSTDDNERALIPQWEACPHYDQMEALPECRVATSATSCCATSILNDAERPAGRLV